MNKEKTFYGVKYEVHRSTWAVEATDPEQAQAQLDGGEGEEVFSPEYVCSLNEAEGLGLEDRILKPSEYEAHSVPVEKDTADVSYWEWIADKQEQEGENE